MGWPPAFQFSNLIFQGFDLGSIHTFLMRSDPKRLQQTILAGNRFETETIPMDASEHRVILPISSFYTP
jgi:hypothetical protein